MSDTLTREDIEALRNFAAESCECPAEVALICLEVPGAACMPCRAKKWIEDEVRLAEELS